MKTITLIILALSLSSFCGACQIKTDTAHKSPTFSFSGRARLGTSFIGSTVTVWDSQPVTLTDSTGNTIAIRDSAKNWHITDTLATVKMLYQTIELIIKYDRQQSELHSAAAQIVWLYQSGKQTPDYRKNSLTLLFTAPQIRALNEAYKQYKHLINFKP